MDPPRNVTAPFLVCDGFFRIYDYLQERCFQSYLSILYHDWHVGTCFMHVHNNSFCVEEFVDNKITPYGVFFLSRRDFLLIAKLLVIKNILRRSFLFFQIFDTPYAFL